MPPRPASWFFVTVMGRHAGHLALGIGGAAGATLTLVAEEFSEGHVPIQRLVDVLEGAIVKRLAHGRDHGVALLAEGLLEKLDPKTLGTVERDAYGNVRLEELELARLLKTRVAASLAARVSGRASWPRISATSSAAPRRAGSTSSTAGASATGPRASCWTAAPKRWRRSRAAGWFAIPFADLLDEKTGKIRVRYADIHSEAYRTLHAYMIRLKREDFERPDQREALARAAKLSEAEFVKRFGYVAGYE